MKVLVAPMNWGLGHASRCIPLVIRYLRNGDEVVLAGDGDSLLLLRKHFPNLRYVRLAPLNLRYGSGKRQVWAMIRALPQLLLRAVKDHAMLQAVLREEHIDRVVSDNRFGLYSTATESVYITHQLHIMLPKGWRWLEPLAARMHARIYMRYNKVWVPDYEAPAHSLSGVLGHPLHADDNPWFREHLSYIGPLSRFERQRTSSLSEPATQPSAASTVAVLSGLEPQRTMLEKQLIAHFSAAGSEEHPVSVLIVQGLPNRPNTRITLPCGPGKKGRITIVPHLSDTELAAALLHARHIIARSGYSTIMDLAALDLLQKAELIPTPGQPEQEYLACWLNRM
jgi:UDP:flavonoid glycosyltransferase YjiC (YdhE family)